MEHKFTSTEILAWENNSLAIERAVETLKDRLTDAPEGVTNDVLKRCNSAAHANLIDWLEGRVTQRRCRVPRAWSPKRSRKVWILYKAADLTCPDMPPSG